MVPFYNSIKVEYLETNLTKKCKTYTGKGWNIGERNERRSK